MARFRISDKKKFRKSMSGIAMLAVLVLMVISAAAILMKKAESRAEKFVVENYIMKQAIFSSEDEAYANTFISGVDWGLKETCIECVIYIDYEGQRVSTTISLMAPSAGYALNIGSAGEEIRVAGEC